MAGSKRLADYLVGALSPSLKDIVEAMERPFLRPQDQKRALHFLVQVRGVVRQIDGGGSTVIFAESSYRRRVAEAAQIIVIRGLLYPLRNALARLLPTEPEQHRFEEKLGAIAEHGLREGRWLDQHEPMKENRGEFLADRLIALIGGHNVQDREPGEAVRVIQRHTVSDTASAIVRDDRKPAKS